MKKRYLLPVLCLLLLFGSTVYAENSTKEVQTEEVNLTEENRYDGIYYQNPEKRYPQGSAGTNSVKGASLTLEEYVVNALRQLQTSINVSAYKIPVEEAAQIYFQILNNNPELFYVKGSIQYSYNPSSGMVISYTVTYNDTEENITNQKAEFEQAAEKVSEQVESSMSDLEKALTVHDYLVLNCEYDQDRLESNNLPDISHTAYGALVNEMAVCDGYADAFSYIMEDKLGIACEVVSSDSMSHAWNMISIGGKWYHVDATWDDPVRDCIGRVKHNYFLLSDTAISDSDHRHTGWTETQTADSALYDTAFWTEISSAICYHQNSWYYAKYNGSQYQVNLVKKQELLGSGEEVVYTENGLWNNYISSNMYLDQEENDLYFNTRTGICRLNESEEPEIAYEPTLSGSLLIFGFTVKENELLYALQETPNLSGKQVIYTQPLEAKPVITGISAADVKAVYDGNAKKITVKGAQAGDTIQYAVDGSYGSEQPEMKQAGTYQVAYRVIRSGYQTFYGSAKVVIEKAAPNYTVPTGLKGKSGKQLKDVALPAGFTWQTAADTRLSKEGTFTYYANYTPSDTKNYKTVSGIAVKVTVSCPGHQYTSKVTKKATETAKGQETYTCKLCGNTYTKEIAMLPPQKPAKVSGLKVSKATASSLKFSWKKANGVNYQLVFYKGSQKVSTKYTKNNSYTYAKLKAATAYTLKVTPYREVNGKKVYAASAGMLKTTTAPAKVKVTSVKQSGKNKAKITWKKVTGASGYEIYMKTGNGKYKKVKTITKGKTVCYTQTKLKKGKTYQFQVRAYTKAGNTKVYGGYGSSKKLKLR